MLKKSLLTFILILCLGFSNVLFAEKIGALTKKESLIKDAKNASSDANTIAKAAQQELNNAQKKASIVIKKDKEIELSTKKIKDLQEKKVELSTNNKPIEEIDKQIQIEADKNRTLSEERTEALSKDGVEESYNSIEGKQEFAKTTQVIAKEKENSLNTTIVKNSNDLKEVKRASSALAESAQQEANELQAIADANPDNQNAQLDAEKAQIIAVEAKKKSDTATEDYDASDKAEGDIASKGFEINVDDISPGMKVNKDRTTTENINFALGTIIQKLMIALGSFALLIMTVGAGYIVMHNGQDELLSKGKSIFMSGIYALVVALGSYYLIVIFRYLLFN